LAASLRPIDYARDGILGEAYLVPAGALLARRAR
jgi:hypothetical protein